MERRLVLGNLVVDFEAYEVWIDQRRIGLTYNEFTLLSLLVKRAGAVMPRTELANAMWGEGADDHRLNVQVCRLRKKLNDSRPWHVRTVRRRGYAFVADAPPAR